MLGNIALVSAVGQDESVYVCNIHTSSPPRPPSPDTNALIPAVTERRAGSVCAAGAPHALRSAHRRDTRSAAASAPHSFPTVSAGRSSGSALHSCRADRCIGASALDSNFYFSA